jgi:CheY-like chemotaxis protein
MATLLETAVGKHARLHLDIASNLPAFEGDAGQIRQVIMNLITNASDAIGAGPGRIHVTTGRMRASRDDLRQACIGSDIPEGDFVFAEVRDDGCGMDEATMTRIFDPFFTTKVSGRGLGLAAALGIVRSHKGAIRITSARGQGTTFRVLLPSSAARVAGVQAPAAVDAPPVNARVLVVDDEESVRAIAQESLRRAGFAVDTAADGATAVELVRASAFDVVLLDLTMPGMSGVDVFGALKDLRPDLPIVLTSGYGRQQTAAQFGNRAIDAFIQKPFLPSALVRTLQAAVCSRATGQVA